jgi:undecaprenyl-diphosphatase
MATMTFVFLILRKYSKYAFLVFLYPLIFAYSRIYLGVHYPTDILTGYTVGATMGGLFYKGYQYFIKRKSS